MQNRITQLLEEKKENIFSIFFTAGYPNLNDTTGIIENLASAGVDLIEIGIPFSDPLADGPIIQASSKIALDGGMTLKILLSQLKDIRQKVTIPLILMGYLNPILQYGEDTFLQDIKEIGIDGLILPDMPLDYYEKNLKEKFEALNISNILLVTPSTSAERLRKIDTLSSGFIYVVSSHGITGSNNNLDAQKDYFEKIQHSDLKNPTLIGFGIHDKQSVQNSFQLSNGAIIGSAFIKALTEMGTSQAAIHSFIKKIRA